LTVAVTAKMVALGVAPSDIGLMAPYRSQLKLLRSKLDAMGIEHSIGSGGPIQIDTIDRFQGSDRQLILMGFVHSPSDSKLGAIVRDWRRINVALTRSKSKLILIASARALRCSKSQILEDLLALLQRKGWVVDVQNEDAAEYQEAAKLGKA